MFGSSFQSRKFLRKRQLKRKLVEQNSTKQKNTIQEGVNELKNKNENPVL